MMTLEHKKRYLAGPRLAKELSGVAMTAIRTRTTRDPQWLAHPRGTYQLLEFLEGVLAKPTLVESSRFIMKFFYNLRRRKGKTMTGWISRHSEALWEASQALRKVQKEFGRGKNQQTQGPTYETPRMPRSGRYVFSTADASVQSEPPSQEATEPAEEGSDASGAQESAERRLCRSGHEGREYGAWAGTNWWAYNSSWWQTAWQGDGDWTEQSWRSQEFAPPKSWDTSSEIFIPEFLAGFLLLHRAGLDAQERANILAAVRGEFFCGPGLARTVGRRRPCSSRSKQDLSGHGSRRRRGR